MADIELTGTIVPKNSGTFPIAQAIHLKGGYHAVADNTARDAIATSRRVAGMGVYSVSAAKLYILGAGLTNSDWAVANAASIPPLSSLLYADKNTSVASGNDGSIGAPFATFAAAVAASPDSGSIALAPGNYGNVTADGKDLAIQFLGPVEFGTLTSDSVLSLQGVPPGDANPTIGSTTAANTVDCSFVQFGDTVTCQRFFARDSIVSAVAAVVRVEMRDCANGTDPIAVTSPILQASRCSVDWTPTDPANQGKLFDCAWTYDSGSVVMPTNPLDLQVNAGTLSRSGLGLIVDSPSGAQNNYLPGGDEIAFAAAHTIILQPTGTVAISGFAQPSVWTPSGFVGRKRVMNIATSPADHVIITYDGSASDLVNRVVRADNVDIHIPGMSYVDLEMFGGGASIIAAGPLPRLPPERVIELVEDFPGGTYVAASPPSDATADWGWLRGDAGGTGSDIVQGALNSTSIVGSVIMTSGTASGAYSAIYGGGDFDRNIAVTPDVSNELRFGGRFFLPTLSNGTNGYRVFLGWSNGWSSGFPTIGAGIEYRSATSTKWRTYTINGGSASAHDSTGTNATVTAGTWHEFDAWKPANGTRWFFFIDRLLQGIETAQVPSGQPIFPMLKIEWVAGTGGVMRVDRVAARVAWPMGR